MRRVSSQMNNMDVQSNLRLQESRLNKINNQIGSQRRIQELRDDPIAAGHLVRYQSYAARIENFEKNAKTLSELFMQREGYMTNSLEVMHRVRELAVTGANGIYTGEDMKNMAAEVDELLKELVQNANAIGEDGNSLFAGTDTKVKAFDVEMGNVAGSGVPLIEGVRYNGNISETQVEIDENKYLTTDNAGVRTFWAEPQQIFGARDTTGWRAGEDSVIAVDGAEIKINAGDNVYSLIAKINDSEAAVKATLDPVTKALNFTTTDARQLWLEDVSGSALADLGIIKDASQKPPYNLASGVRASGGSMFDAVISLRNALLAGDHEAIGGRVLGSIDQGLNNLTTRIAKSGSEYERAELNVKRNSGTALNVTQRISSEGDLDLTKAASDMKMMDFTHQATLSTAARLYSSTLLDYLR
ncbi:flagellar hook-associated protein 3 [Treponema sp. Marseille-Q4130]|uniref:flagellar hook-associated protein 3 n=1 Tax=Treponema sp. Marseille-Q4130 TaxID=2766702 RepID=UPI0016529C0D|nr:flagellar hook-associated protein 3 [Treponema sp. Marseille-Q4130]MBC6719377.1 flagellar hook-associated protein 3 [Treponema sp. Marseille-Q4130]